MTFVASLRVPKHKSLSRSAQPSYGLHAISGPAQWIHRAQGSSVIGHYINILIKMYLKLIECFLMEIYFVRRSISSSSSLICVSSCLILLCKILTLSSDILSFFSIDSFSFSSDVLSLSCNSLILSSRIWTFSPCVGMLLSPSSLKLL